MGIPSVEYPGTAVEVGVLAQALDNYDPTGAVTGELVADYRRLNPLAQSAKKAREAIRDELYDRMAEATEDAKGNKHFDGADGSKLEFRARIKTEFKPEVAKALLEARGLYEHCIETEVVVTDPEKLASVLEEVQERLIQMGETALAQRIETALTESTERRETIAEPKIEAFVKRGKVSVTEAETMYDITKTYSLYDITP